MPHGVQENPLALSRTQDNQDPMDFSFSQVPVYSSPEVSGFYGNDDGDNSQDFSSNNHQNPFSKTIDSRTLRFNRQQKIQKELQKREEEETLSDVLFLEEVVPNQATRDCAPAFNRITTQGVIPCNVHETQGASTSQVSSNQTKKTWRSWFCCCLSPQDTEK